MKTWVTILQAVIGFGLLWWAVLAEVQAGEASFSDQVDSAFEEINKAAVAHGLSPMSRAGFDTLVDSQGLMGATLMAARAIAQTAAQSLDERFQELLERFESTVRRTQAESRARVEARNELLERGEGVVARAGAFCDLWKRGGGLPEDQREILRYHCAALTREAADIAAELNGGEGS